MRISLIALLSLGAFALGCEQVELTALHGPPPGARAELNRESETIVLSRGVALAVDCSFGYGESCENIEAIAGNESTAQSYRLFRDGLLYDYQEGPQPESGFVIVGLSEGKTELEILTEQGDLRFEVEVVAP